MYYPPLPPGPSRGVPATVAPSILRLTFAVKTALGGHLGLFGPLLGPHLAHLSTFCDQLGSLRAIFAPNFAKNHPKGPLQGPPGP